MHACIHACRCPKVPYASLHSAASIFHHTDVCNVGDNVLPGYGPHFVPDKKNISWRRMLQTKPQGARSRQQVTLYTHKFCVMLSCCVCGVLCCKTIAVPSVSGVAIEHKGVLIAGRKLVEDGEVVEERGVKRERFHLKAGVDIRTTMVDQLRKHAWLEDFIPMPIHCPLLGRRVAWQAVSDYAALAWSCEGLGFAWECLDAGS